MTKEDPDQLINVGPYLVPIASPSRLRTGHRSGSIYPLEGCHVRFGYHNQCKVCFIPESRHLAVYSPCPLN